MPKLALDTALHIAAQLGRFIDFNGVRISLGDFNDNGDFDVTIELVMEDDDVITLGPLDVGDHLDAVSGALLSIAGLARGLLGKAD